VSGLWVRAAPPAAAGALARAFGARLRRVVASASPAAAGLRKITPFQTLLVKREPMNTFLQQILIHTPAFVWGILALCIVMGLLQSRDQRMARQRLLAVPAIWTAFGLWGVASAFGLHAQNLAAWALGLALVVAAMRPLRGPQGVRFEAASGRYFVPGSWLPMAMILAIFLAKYIVGVALSVAPQLAQVQTFALDTSLLYGALSGLFIGRSRSLLRHGSGAGSAPVAA
jgi:hypothetical protein